MEETVGPPEVDLDALSFDAKVLASAWFGMGMRTSVTLHLREKRPTPRTQAAIDELVAAGAASRAPFNEYGGLVLRPLVDCSPAFRWMGRLMQDDGPEGADFRAGATWTLTEPIDEDQARDLMTPYGQGVWDRERRGLTARHNPHDATTAAEAHADWKRGNRTAAR